MLSVALKVKRDNFRCVWYVTVFIDGVGTRQTILTDSYIANNGPIYSLLQMLGLDEAISIAEQSPSGGR